MRKITIFGSGGFAREVLMLIHDINATKTTWDVVGFLDGNPASKGKLVHGLPVLGGVEFLREHPEVAVAVGVGSPATRRKIVRSIEAIDPNRFATLVHPRAWLGAEVKLGSGTIICAGSMLTCDIRLGRHVIINLNCTVGHDAVLGDFVTVAPGANISGAVVVGEGCDLGTNSAYVQGMEIGEWTIIGGGAVVSGKIPPNVTAVGVPAKPIKERPAGWQDA